MTQAELDRFRWDVACSMKRNLFIFLLVEAVWGAGYAFVSQVAILPFFLRQLGASDTIIGALPAVSVLTLCGVQLWAAHLTEHLPVKRVVFTCVHYPAAAAVLAMALIAHYSSRLGGEASSVGVLVCAGVWGLSMAFCVPMWTNLIAKLFPERARGRFFGYAFLVGSVTGIAGAALAQRLLASLPFPDNFAVAFGLSSIMLAASVTAFLWLREPALPAEVERVPFGPFIRRLWMEASSRRGYRALMWARVVASLGAMASAFYAVSARERFGLGDGAAASFTMASVAAQIVGSLLAGALGDRVGFHVFAPLSPALAAVACWLALTAPAPWAFYVVFALSGYIGANDFVAVTNLTIEYCPRLEKTAFISLIGTATAPFTAASPVIGGWLAQATGGYAAVFRTAMVLNIAAAILAAILVRDPRRDVSGGARGEAGGEGAGTASPACAPEHEGDQSPSDVLESS